MLIRCDVTTSMRTLLCSAFLLAALPLLSAPPMPVKPGQRTPVQFKETIPQNSNEQYQMRMSAPEAPAAYDISQETFELLLPRNYKETEPHGLFVWISPGPKPDLSPDWEKVLADSKLIFVSALNSGNNRETPDRIRLAVEASHHLRQWFNVDPQRVYISGHSGGARVASMIGVAYADMFSGAACFMGVNFFRDTEGKDGTFYERRYVPHPEIAILAQQHGRFALVTGEKDSNLINTKAVFEQGFKAQGFKGARLFEIPNQGHNRPDGRWLEKVIRFLDTGK